MSIGARVIICSARPIGELVWIRGHDEDHRHPHRDPGAPLPAILERKAARDRDAQRSPIPIVAAEARGATLTDVDGNTFIDFTGGVGCLNVGHSHPHVVAAAHEQLERFTHTDFTIVPYEPYVALAERLLERAPISGADEGRVLQRRHRGGRERGQVCARLHEAARRDRVRGRLPRPHAALADADVEDAPVQGRARAVRARGLPRAVPAGLPRPRRRDGAGGAAARFVTQVAAEKVAAIVVEPVQGEGGFLPAPPRVHGGAARDLRRQRHRAVVDEVQTGFARTGRLFAIEHYDVEPDLITVAKSIAAGLPLSGVLGRAEIMDAAPTAPSAAPTSATRSPRRRRSPSST